MAANPALREGFVIATISFASSRRSGLGLGPKCGGIRSRAKAPPSWTTKAPPNINIGALGGSPSNAPLFTPNKHKVLVAAVPAKPNAVAREIFPKKRCNLRSLWRPTLLIGFGSLLSLRVLAQAMEEQRVTDRDVIVRKPLNIFGVTE